MAESINVESVITKTSVVLKHKSAIILSNYMMMDVTVGGPPPLPLPYPWS